MGWTDRASPGMLGSVADIIDWVGDDPLYLAIAIFAFSGILFLSLIGRPRLFAGGKGRLPKRFIVKDIPSGDIPLDAQKPLQFLVEKIRPLGFETADLPVRVPALQTFGYRLLIVPFVNLAESTFFLLGIEVGLHPRTQLMLHIITPLTKHRRVETTTLSALENLLHPPEVNAQIVLDADTVEEIWSRHRRSLSTYERSERADVSAERWREFAAVTYDGWVQSGVRAQRLTLEKNGETYRVRSPPKSIT